MNTANRITLIPRHRGGDRWVSPRGTRRAPHVRLRVVRHIGVDAKTHSANGGGGQLRCHFWFGVNNVGCGFQSQSYGLAVSTSLHTFGLKLLHLALRRPLDLEQYKRLGRLNKGRIRPALIDSKCSTRQTSVTPDHVLLRKSGAASGMTMVGSADLI